MTAVADEMSSRTHAGILTFVCAACLFPIILLINGAVPGVLAPTTGQALWITSFAQSFARDMSIHAHNFGLPQPAAMSFGLSMALPQAVLIYAGADPATAYVIIAAIWLAVAYWGAYNFSRWIGAGKPSSIMSALVWCTLPIIWTHQPYSAVGSGMALLPFYFLFAFKLIGGDVRLSTCASCIVACFIAVFMDGYTFMMMATGVGLALGCEIALRRDTWKSLLFRACIISAGLGSAYVAYALYEGVADFDGSPIDFFRAWGANIEFFFTPTKGLLTLADLIGWGKDRAETMYFGDGSVYIATFAGVLIALAVFALLSGRTRPEYRVTLTLITVVGFWLALGPTVKLFTHRPEGASQLMSAQYGLFPSGNGWLINLPGFQSMRASYRWAALAFFGCWAIVVSMIASGGLSNASRAWLLATLLAFNVPSLSQFRGYQISQDRIENFLAEMSSWAPYFNRGETVAFLPYGNDFTANTAANELDIRTYNIGGNKNQTAAQQAWPEEMNVFPFGQQGPDFAYNVKAFLDSGKADAVVLPYINMLWASHLWPVPADQKANLEPIAQKIDEDPRYDVQYAPHFAVIRKH
ncbi:hypothetical protein FJ986_15565 [Mesorhizobium sp. B1-1-1]|uniref:hypothetical protein n=1 Tax=Mesorhizobium sp. B1-1-1 TaxID=2589983 RepID=UPI00112E3450|nr:hypothetical protein [Mesorhizobium sp. B1-1-1]TPN65750.1 hypothetical protein FJ986_15565 [Mesorhizobium sp. B1-1-1]